MQKPVTFGLGVTILVGLALGASPVRGESIAGVCPDGSAFIVQTRGSAPCPNARFVHPSNLPPLRPELLPKPYMWYVDQQQRDTNNPYYLVEQANRMRALRAQQLQASRGRADSRARYPDGTAPVSAPAPLQVPGLELDERELGDMVKLIALRQSLAPATLDVKDAHGNDQLRIRFAHSGGFEARVLEALGSDASEQRVLAFYARATAKTDFHPNFLVVQDGRTFRPDKSTPEEVGLLVGEAGRLDAGLLVMGYFLIPARFDPSRPTEIYWNDRSLVTTLRP
jgi:hypothetical protein